MRISALIFSFKIALFAVSMDELKSNIKTQNIDGNFTQTKILSGFANPFKSYGNFALKENELIWHTFKPINAKVVINEKGIFEQRGEELISIGQNFDKKLFLSIVKLDKEELEKEFSLEIAGLKEGWRIELKPKNILLKNIFSHITISGDKFVEKIELFEISGDTTINEFYDIR